MRAFIWYKMFISETQLKKNNLIAIIPTLSPEWSISLSVRLHSIPSDEDVLFCNIIHVSRGGNSKYGDRSPMVFMSNQDLKVSFVSSISGDQTIPVSYDRPLVVNQTYFVEINQRYVMHSNGTYQFSVSIDGNEFHEVMNTDARQFHQMRVYASSPWEVPCPMFIRNFKLTNFT